MTKIRIFLGKCDFKKIILNIDEKKKLKIPKKLKDLDNNSLQGCLKTLSLYAKKKFNNVAIEE